MLKKELGRQGLDTFLSLQNTRYFTGTTAGKAVIVPFEGDPILICSRLEQSQAIMDSMVRDIRAYSSWKAPLQRGERVLFLEPWQTIAECLRELGAHAVGYDKASRGLIRKLRNVHAASYEEKLGILQNLRMIKSKEELKILRMSASIAVEGMNRVAELIEPGRTELEIAAKAEYVMRRAGSDGIPFQTIVASGRNSWLPHASATKKKLGKGELVVVDLGATFDGYASDMTRTFAIEPTKTQSKLLEIVKRAQLKALKKIRDGAKAKDVDEAARRAIAGAGYAKFFTHGSGHGVGLEIHEAPSLAPISEDVLSSGMVLTVEPGIYVPKIGGTRWEDMVLVKPKGYEFLTR